MKARLTHEIPVSIGLIVLALWSSPLARQRRASWQPSAREQMTYMLYLGPIRIGRAALAIGRAGRKGGRDVVLVRGRAEAARKLLGSGRYAEELVTAVELAKMLPVTSTLTTERAKRQVKTTVTRYGQGPSGTTNQRIERPKGRMSNRSRRLRRNHHGPLSVILMLRRAEKLHRRDLTVLVGTKLYRIRVLPKGKGRVSVNGRRRSGVRFDAVAHRVTDSGRAMRGKRTIRLTLWLSADSRRIPLALEIGSRLGSVRAVLRGYAGPTASKAQKHTTSAHRLETAAFTPGDRLAARSARQPVKEAL